jgi:hypothetical protein
MNRYFAWGWLWVPLILLSGCARSAVPTPTASPEAVIAPPPITQAPLPTLVPTFTPLPEANSLPTAGPSGERETAEPAEPSTSSEDFNEIIVDLRYAVPATGLARRLQGNRANRITFVDETSGQATAYSNQGGVLFELRQALLALELEPVPVNCDSCVFVQYELSLEERRSEGWLQDPVLLASIENFLSVALGPHFPAETILGLRRSASPYAPAHTLALTQDGQLWRWLATDAQVAAPTTAITSTQPLQSSLEALPLADLGTEYVVGCQDVPVETIYLNPTGEAHTISIVCPEYSLPSILLPLYLELDEALQPILAEVSLERPPSAFPLEAVLDYRRSDGNRLTLFQDGQLVMIDTASVRYTNTLSITRVVSLTQELLASDELEPGLSTFGIGATATITPSTGTATPGMTSVVILRGPNGLNDGEWVELPSLPVFDELDALLDENLGLETASEPEGTATLEPTATAEDEETATPSPTPAATATP